MASARSEATTRLEPIPMLITANGTPEETIELFVDRNAMCTAPTVKVFVANLFVSLTPTCVPPSFENTLSRNVWLLKEGAACTAPFTVVDRKDAAQLSTHFSVTAASVIALIFWK